MNHLQKYQRRHQQTQFVTTGKDELHRPSATQPTHLISKLLVWLIYAQGVLWCMMHSVTALQTRVSLIASQRYRVCFSPGL